MTKRIVIHGRVQGVGFRAFVYRLATNTGLSGQVSNCRDGTVECIVQSEDEQLLEMFVRALSKGPGHVANVTATTHDDHEFDEFQIIR